MILERIGIVVAFFVRQKAREVMRKKVNQEAQDKK